MRHRIALIGFGEIARAEHLPAIERDARFELVAIVDVRGTGYPGLPAFDRTDALLAHATELALAAVALCTPPVARYPIARACLTAGLHTLLEKPPGVTVGEVEALLVLAQHREVTLFTAWHAQVNAAVTAAAEWLARRRIRTLHIVWQEDVREWHPGQAWIWQPGGFGVFDAGINALSILTRVLPGPLMVRDAELGFPANRETPIVARLNLASPLVEGSLTAVFDWRCRGAEQWTIRGETWDGECFELLDGGARLVIDGAELAESGCDEYCEIYRRFGELIERGAHHVDLAPLRLVADACLIGRRTRVGAFTD